MNPEMKIMREVSDQAENFYDDAVGLGNHAANALEARHRSQMTELENIADSALKSSDIFDYIKKQSARFTYWRKGFSEYSDPKIGFGERLKTYLEKDMAQKLATICDSDHLDIGNSSDGDKKKRRRIYLMLIRQFIHQMVAEYEYQTSPAPPAKKKEA